MAKVELIVKLVSGAAPGSATSHSVIARAADHGITLEPVDRSASDIELAAFYVAFVAPEAAARAIDALRQCDGVETVYAKPRSEPPVGGVPDG